MVKRMRSFFAVVMLVIAATVNAQVYLVNEWKGGRSKQ